MRADMPTSKKKNTPTKPRDFVAELHALMDESAAIQRKITQVAEEYVADLNRQVKALAS